MDNTINTKEKISKKENNKTKEKIIFKKDKKIKDETKIVDICNNIKRV